MIEDLSLHSHRLLISIPGQHGLTIDLLEGFFRTFISSGHAMSHIFPGESPPSFKATLGGMMHHVTYGFKVETQIEACPNWGNWVTHAIYRDIMQSRKPLVTTNAEDRAIRANVRPIQRCLGLQQSFRSERSALHHIVSLSLSVFTWSSIVSISAYDLEAPLRLSPRSPLHRPAQEQALQDASSFKINRNHWLCRRLSTPCSASACLISEEEPPWQTIQT